MTRWLRGVEWCRRRQVTFFLIAVAWVAALTFIGGL